MVGSDGGGWPTMIDVIQKAGGISASGDLARLELLRPSPSPGGPTQSFVFDYLSVLKNGGFAPNPLIYDGDSIRVHKSTTPINVDLLTTAASNFAPRRSMFRLWVRSFRLEWSRLDPMPLCHVPFLPPEESPAVEAWADGPGRMDGQGRITVKQLHSPNALLSSVNNPPLRNGDVVVVDRSNFTKVTDTMADAVLPLEPVVDAASVFHCLACRRRDTRPGRLNPRSVPDHAQILLVQCGAEAVGQFGCRQPAGDIPIRFKVGAEVAAGNVPGRVGVALNDPVSLLSAHAGAHKSEQHPLAEHHTAVNIHVAAHVLGVIPRPFTTLVISRSMKCRVTEQSGGIIRSVELWLMSRSCQRATFSGQQSSGTAFQAKPLIRSLRIGLRCRAWRSCPSGPWQVLLHFKHIGALEVANLGGEALGEAPPGRGSGRSRHGDRGRSPGCWRCRASAGISQAMASTWGSVFA